MVEAVEKFDRWVWYAARAWLSEIEDLVDESVVAVGDVRRKGRRMENLATLHQVGRRGCSAVRLG